MKPEEYTDETGPKGRLIRNPYEQVGKIGQFLASGVYTLLGHWPKGCFARKILAWLIKPILKSFVTLKEPDEFWDTAWKGLPMDNQISDRLLPTEFTELWFDIRDTQAIMERLRAHYEDKGIEATGTYCCEIYAAKSSRFWMSPSHERDVLRLDFFWFARNKGNPGETFYPQFWNLLKEFDFTLHWGKYLPEASPFWVAYLKSQYPRWDHFLDTRKQMDPNQVFVTEYWREHLGIGN